MARCRRITKRSQEESLESMPTIKGLYEGTLLVFCPTCGAGIPEPVVRDILKRVLQEANIDLCKRLFGPWTVKK